MGWKRCKSVTRLRRVQARNLGLLMRKVFGIGTPRGLQPEGDASSLVYLTHALLATVWIVLQRAWNDLKSRAVLTVENRRRPSRLAPVA